MKKRMLLVMSFLCISAGAWAQQAGKQAVNADSVPIEEYVPKVIIEGKWGTGPGEFGVAWTYATDITVPQNESGEIPPIYPDSIAVNSKGEIYLLDSVNNRIQKFSPEGKYVLSLPVESYNGKEQAIWYGKIIAHDGREVLDRVADKASQGNITGVDRWFPFYWPLTAMGVNIVIDAKGTLYYYLKRMKDGKETGEVWEFRKDMLVRKYTSAQKGGLPAKFQFAPVGYNQFVLTVGELPVAVPKQHKYSVTIKKEGGISRILIEDSSKKVISKIEIPPAPEYTAAKAGQNRVKSDVYFEKMLDNGNFQVRTVNGSVDNIATEEREYTPEGKLVRRVKSPPGYSHGIDVGLNGITVVRWVIQKRN